MKLFLITTLTLALSGCALFDKKEPDPVPPSVTIQEKYIPVSRCPVSLVQINRPDRPVLPILQLTDADRQDYTKVARAYMLSVTSLQAYAEQLENVIMTTQTACEALNSTNIQLLTQ